MQWLWVLAIVALSLGMAQVWPRRALAAASAQTPGRGHISRLRLQAAAAAVLVGSAVWAMHFVGSLNALHPLGSPWGALATIAWGLTVASALPLALLQAAAPEAASATRWQPWLAALGLGLGVLACQTLSFASVEAVPMSAQGLPWALTVVGSVALGQVLALELRRLSAPGPGRWVLQGGALATATLGLCAHNLSGLVGNTLAVLALVGLGGLTIALAALCAVERRVGEALHQASALVEHNAQTDPLTGLPNCGALEQKLVRVARSAAKRERTLVLMLVSVDNLKSIADTFGREASEALFVAIAKRLESLAPRQYLARVSNDEFGLLMASDVGESTDTALAARICKALQSDFLIEAHRMSPRCSIGVAESPRHGDHTTLLAHAEAAVRTARQRNALLPVVFELQMLDEMREQLELLADLRGALTAGQMSLYYQPKVHAPSGEITGAEALLRWKHPRRGFVPPAQFIPLAERHNLIDELGNWVIDEACRQARVWRDEGLRMRVAINLSVCQLRQPDLAQRIGSALERHQINPQLLTCEITESLAMEDSQTTIAFFEEIARLGVRLSIDDFGTGYSSLAYLRKLPAEELKIDRSFVFDLGSSPDARAVVDAVIKLAHALDLKVVAEGVETEQQREILRELGCHELQGYLFAKPMAAADLGLWALDDAGPRSIGFRDSLFRSTTVVSEAA